ncbi:hypothetical protein Tco_0155510 [Tanacetum coccineum]
MVLIPFISKELNVPKVDVVHRRLVELVGRVGKGRGRRRRDGRGFKYMHMGPRKPWYGVPRDVVVAFEDAVRVYGNGGSGVDPEVEALKAEIKRLQKGEYTAEDDLEVFSTDDLGFDWISAHNFLTCLQQLSSYTSGHFEVSELAACLEKLHFPALLVMSKFS